MYTSFSEVKIALQQKQATCESIVKHYLQVIEQKKHLNAFNEVFTESALQKATEVDDKIKSGTAGKLAGMVIAIKDNICYKGHKVSVSSKILENFQSIYSSTVVEKLLAEDAIIIGRTNCDEFAMGSSNENSAFGKVLNPLDETTVPGGSSGGSAVAVAAGMCLASLGTDTGGSIRQPASFTGTVGLKPTYGRVSRHGIVAYASSFDQVGPFSSNVEDTALIMEVIAGQDEYDATLSSQKVDDYSNFNKPEKLKIAYIKDCFDSEGLDAEIKSTLLNHFEKLKQQGHSVEAVDFPYLDFLVPSYYVLTTAEASSNLGRYDGMRYGFRSANATDLESTYKKSRSEGFGKEVKRRIMLGTFVLSEGYYDAYYGKAQKVRRLLLDKTNEILAKYDFIVMPTTPSVAFKFGQNSKDPIKMYLEDIFTVQANLTGLPAISIPAGKNKNNLPFGIQLMGKAFSEKALLSFANYLEKEIVN